MQEQNIHMNNHLISGLHTELWKIEICQCTSLMKGKFVEQCYETESYVVFFFYIDMLISCAFSFLKDQNMSWWP